MILSALNDYYERLLEHPDSGIAPMGYSYEKISYALVIDLNGNLVDLMDLRDTSGKKPRPSRQLVPQAEVRTAGIKPFFLWDKSSYVLGVSDIKETDERKRDRRIARVSEEHNAFKAFHEKLLADVEDEGLRALVKFLRSWNPAEFQDSSVLKEEVLGTNLVFRLDGREQGYIHERRAARELQGQRTAELDAHEGFCLVSGENAPVTRLHPAIKGVKGAQSSGAAIVSFNLDAFTSYGKSQGQNSPVSQKAAFAYTTTLNHLLRNENDNRQRLQIGDATTVFWALTETSAAAKSAEMTFADLLDPRPDDTSETGKLRDVLEAIAKGRPLREVNPDLEDNTTLYILGLAPNASRLAVRYWEKDSLHTFAERIGRHYEDLHLEPMPWKTPPGIWRLLLQTAPHPKAAKPKPDDIPPQLAGEMTRAILTGRRYPRSLLTNIIMRMRSDGDISGLRVALCKGVLARDQRLGVKGTQQEVPVSLDKENTSPGYRLGRLFATLENIQRAALGSDVNATIRDRYYGAASATPASIFPVLLRNAQHHLARLRKDKPGLAVNLEKAIAEIMDGLEATFPKNLTIQSQGQFAIGYYHQAQSRFSNKDQSTEGVAS